jgi:hypothetical protein
MAKVHKKQSCEGLQLLTKFYVTLLCNFTETCIGVGTQNTTSGETGVRLISSNEKCQRRDLNLVYLLIYSIQQSPS